MGKRTSVTFLLAVAALGAASGFVVCGATFGENFRVENAIYAGKEKEPCVESTTIFYCGIVYDYLKSPTEVTIFDKDNGRFVLLDLSRRMKTEVPAEKAVTLCEHLRTWAMAQSDPLLRFLANPRFDEQYDASSGKLILSSEFVTYELATDSAESVEICRDYRQFCDWYCQLNTLLNPGSRPPFARMAVNAALERHQRFPKQVELTLRLNRFPPRRLTVHSEHQLVRKLVDSDRDRVAQTNQYLAIFNPVAFDEYQKKPSSDPTGDESVKPVFQPQ